MAKNIEQVINAIDTTIAARKEQLPAIQAECSRISKLSGSLSMLNSQLDELLHAGADETVSEETREAKETLASFVKKLEDYQLSLMELEEEFTRDTLNIGVSGEARTGKSTTLQHITGLSDSQIPSGGLNPVTAVRSEIYNSDRNQAVITFKTEASFIEGYVRPHVDNVNKYLPESKQLSICSLSALKAATLPSKLESNESYGVDSAATDSLKRLREAQRSVSTFERFLGAEPRTVSLNEVMLYVTYPAPGAEANEMNGGAPCDRRYLAVELAQIYCQFPNLGSAKVGLVDLPGMGEIGNSANSIHLKGLESKVDQIFLVMRPTAAKAFASAEVACNLDQLNTIQPAVKRGDLVVAGINKDAQAGEIAAVNLRNSFESEINAGRTDTYEIVDYCAISNEDVARVFGMLLDRLGELLPEMDQQKLAYCMGGLDLSDQISAAMDELVFSMNRILRSIPSSDRVMKNRIDAINRAIIGELKAYEVQLSNAAQQNSKVFQEFIADAERIHDEVARHIVDDLFRASEAEWMELTSSSKDYYNLYRDEDKRLRYEIIDAYCELDRFYDTHMSTFKLHVLDALLSACNMDTFFDFSENTPVNKRIAKVESELSSTLHDADLSNALTLLEDMKFDFRSNVFLQIEEHLSALANPVELVRNSNQKFNKREILGGEGPAASKQKSMRKFLQSDARRANNDILDALKSEQDRFNKYLAVSIDFFNNYLFGKDEDNFKQVVIRGLIREYKPWVLPDADDASKSPLGKIAESIKNNAQELQRGQGNFAGMFAK